MTQRHGTLDPEGPESRWLAWARRTAHAGDPLRSGVQADGMRRWQALQASDSTAREEK